MPTLPTMAETNNNFMMQNPQYGYSPTATDAPRVPPGSPEAAAAQQKADMEKYFPTVLTNTTKLDTTIPTLNQKGNTIAQGIAGGVANTKATDAANKENRLEDTSYSSIFDKAMSDTEASGKFNISPEQQQLYTMMQGNIDAQTAAALSSIQQQYAAKEGLLIESQKASTKGAENVLNLGGSARYAPLSSMGVMEAKNRYDMQTLNELHAAEEAAKASVLQAQREGNFQLMESKMNALEKLRGEKIAFAGKIADDMAAQNKLIRDKQIQSSRDEAIAGLVQQGITDPSEIMALLEESAQASGTTSDFTAEEIGKTLKVLTPDSALAGLDADFKTYNYLKTIGDPAVKGLSYLDYKGAVANATRAPKASEGDISLTTAKKTELLGAGFSQNDIKNIEDDIQAHGVDAVLEGITDPTQQKAIKDAYGVTEKVTREQVDTTVTQKAAYDGLKEAYTDQELKVLADEAGLSSMWTGKESDVERFLNDPAAKKIYADLLWEQYKAAGMTE